MAGDLYTVFMTYAAKRNITQAEVAYEAGVSQSYLSEILRGKKFVPAGFYDRLPPALAVVAIPVEITRLRNLLKTRKAQMNEALDTVFSVVSRGE